MLRRSLVVLCLVVPSLARADGDGFGAWTGAIQIAGHALHIDVTLKDATAGTIDIPEQGAHALPLSNIKVAGDVVEFVLKLPNGDASFAGKLAAGAVTGQFTQAGQTFPFALTRPVAAASAPALPPLAAKDAGPLLGRWTGTIADTPKPIDVELELIAAGDGVGGALDVPKQCLGHQKVVRVGRGADGRVRVEVKTVFGTLTFEGTVDKDAFTGDYEQHGEKVKFALARAARPADDARPYTEERVTYPSGAITLAATLTRPRGAAKVPAVVMITGSGPQDRDECVLGVRPFAAIADALARSGVAVLRADDRGVGESTGDFTSATPPDFVADAAAGLAYLRARADIDGAHLGLIGHSEGGIIGPMVAAQDPGVAFVVLLAGPVQTLTEIILEQQALIARADGAPAKAVAAEVAMNRKVFAAAKQERDPKKLAAAVKAILQAGTPKAELAKVGSLDVIVARAVAQASSPWFRYYLDYDPAPTLAKVRCPVLALNGALDLQVPPKENLALVRSVLGKAKNPDFKAIELPGLNHLFQKAKTGSPSEYAQLPPTIDASMLDALTAWVTAHAR